MSWITVGIITQPHGLKGELYVHLFSLQADWLAKLQEHKKIRLIKEEQETIMSLKQVRPHKKGLIVWPEEVQDRNQALLYKRFSMQIPEEFLVSEKGEPPYFKELLNFSVYWVEDSEGSPDDKERIGVVKSFVSFPAQDILILETSSQTEHSIPFVKEFIFSIDYEEQNIIMSFPKDLLEI